jgi:hypothetical protein
LPGKVLNLSTENKRLQDENTALWTIGAISVGYGIVISVVCALK